jgi:hypothetical protein
MLRYGAQDWIRWSEKHPEVAAALWPRVLAELGSDDERGEANAMRIMKMMSRDRVTTLEGFHRALAAAGMEK